MSQELTIKQRGFVRDVLETHNPTEAAWRNYRVCSRKVAKVIACQNMRKPTIRMAINFALDQETEYPELIVKTIKSLLRSPNWRARSQGLKLLLKIKGS